MAEINFENTGHVIDEVPGEESAYHVPSEAEKSLVSFIVGHTDKWRDYRDQNFLDDWDKYERIFRGKWKEEDKQRGSERSRVISPASQQAVETRHAEVMEAIFGQGEFFDIKDDVNDQNGRLDVEKLKNQLKEDFSQDKIRKSIDQIVLMGEIYGTGIGEIVVSSEKQYQPMTVPMDQGLSAYGVVEKDRISVKLSPVNPKNFIFDPNGTSVDDCMGVAIERYTSIHKVSQEIADGTYLNVDIHATYTEDQLEPTQQAKNYDDDRVLLLTYYGLVPREYLKKPGEEVVELGETEDYSDMAEAIVVIANGGVLLKAEESPYMMKDRPILSYQSDTVPNRLLGRGTVEKAFNMQMAIDGSARSHMDALALTVAPMIAVDASRLPRGAKFEVKPGKAFMTNGAPQDILMPFKFGTNDGQALLTAKEFERMLLMATGTIDSNGMVSQVARDGMDMATATMIKKYKRTLVNFQEDFLIPFIYKATWRYMQFSPERYPAVDVKFIPTATLGIIAREYEQKQLAFLIQTLGAQSPLTPVLMEGVLQNSSVSNREEMIERMRQMSQPDPQQQQMGQQKMMLDMQLVQANIAKLNAEAQHSNADAQKKVVETQLAPTETKARFVSALARNLPAEDNQDDFSKRAKIAELALKEEDIRSNERIAKMQMEVKREKDRKNSDYLDKAKEVVG